jgi:pre-mRNA-splicing helicase BRR2
VTEEVGTHYNLWETARSLRETAVDKETITQFVKPDGAVREILNEEAQNVKDTNLQDLLPFGFAIHHAGMSREDCGLVEELFTDGSIQVLVCTATLAWGINLPATPSPSRARKSTTPKKDDGLSCHPRTYFRSSVVLVVFNTIRSARVISLPTFRNCNITSACSTSIELPTESQFVSADSLNAEIVLGTIRNRDEAVQWIGYTYL